MRLLLLILAIFAVPAVVFFVALNFLASDEKTDCTKVHDPKPGAWQAGDFHARERIAEDLSLCERMQGRTQPQVEALLGSPSQARSGELRYRLFAKPGPDGVLPTDAWVIFLGADGRVSDTRLAVFTGF